MDLAAEGILGDFEGSPVTCAGVEVRNAAGGLNDALGIDPVVMQKGDTCYVVMRCDVVDLHFPNVKGHEDQSRRVHVLRATDATIMDDETVIEAIDNQRARIQEERDRIAGVSPLFPRESADERDHRETEPGGIGAVPSEPQTPEE
jgi:hypothetical protein